MSRAFMRPRSGQWRPRQVARYGARIGAMITVYASQYDTLVRPVEELWVREQFGDSVARPKRVKPIMD